MTWQVAASALSLIPDLSTLTGELPLDGFDSRRSCCSSRLAGASSSVVPRTKLHLTRRDKDPVSIVFVGVLVRSTCRLLPRRCRIAISVIVTGRLVHVERALAGELSLMTYEGSQWNRWWLHWRRIWLGELEYAQSEIGIVLWDRLGNARGQGAF